MKIELLDNHDLTLRHIQTFRHDWVCMIQKAITVDKVMNKYTAQQMIGRRHLYYQVRISPKGKTTVLYRVVYYNTTETPFRTEEWFCTNLNDARWRFNHVKDNALAIYKP